MTIAATTLPHWEMTTIYPGLDSPEFAAGFAALAATIDELERLFGRHGIAAKEVAPLSDAELAAFDEVATRFDAMLRSSETIEAYIAAFATTNSRDDLAQAKRSEFERQQVRISQLGTRLTAWIGSLDVDLLIDRSAIAREHEHALRLAEVQATHLMSPEEEELASELQLTGSTAWTTLYTNVWSQINVPLERDGEAVTLPMSAVRNLAYEADREVRRRAYEAELDAWRTHALPIAAALNGIKGENNTLLRRRGWTSSLEVALFQNHIDRATLDAMMAAAREAFPEFRRYLRAKARRLGIEQLAWYDLFAPVESSGRVWEWDDAASFIVEQFATYSGRMHDLADRAFRERWIDAEPRSGKTGGAFCMPLRADESRILANYAPSYVGMSTLAHELGHAYHNLNLAGRTMLQRITPSTLAETASTFCETIVRTAALSQADAEEELEILEGSLQTATGMVVDITSRFLFEQQVFETRRDRELSIDDFCRLTLDAQRETYGDALDSELLHPFMWAVKPHYYRADESFYNFPYMFGLLFGIGLFARYEQDPEVFRAGYDSLLSATGMADAATLASRFGIDLRSIDFWRSSLAVIQRDVERYVELATR